MNTEELGLKEEQVEKLRDLLQVGNKLKIFYNEGNYNNHVAHVRALVDDYYVVLKMWSKSKQRWFYSIEVLYYFSTLLDRGYITKVK